MSAPSGMIMNSWKSTLLSACLPPLRTFIIGTGRYLGVGAAEIAVERQPDRRGRGMGHRQRDAENGVGAELRLVRRAVEIEHELVDAEPVRDASMPSSFGAMMSLTLLTALSTPLPR